MAEEEMREPGLFSENNGPFAKGVTHEGLLESIRGIGEAGEYLQKRQQGEEEGIPLALDGKSRITITSPDFGKYISEATADLNKIYKDLVEARQDPSFALEILKSFRDRGGYNTIVGKNKDRTISNQAKRREIRRELSAAKRGAFAVSTASVVRHFGVSTAINLLKLIPSPEPKR